MSSVTSRDRGVQILARMIRPELGGLSSDAARSILAIRLPPDDCDRVNELAGKARSGELTEEERSELDEYEHVTAVVEIMQSKARLSLKQAGLRP
jgi:hypothetical protein